MSTIPFYSEINEFLEGIQSAHRTLNPLFYCLKMEETYPHTRDVMPPFKKGFYFISFVTNAGSTQIQYDQGNETKLDSFLVFQSPGHIYSWHRDKQVKGYLIYFKKECFSFFRPDFEKEFPFFNVLQTNFFRINQQVYRKYEPLFQSVFAAYNSDSPNKYQVAALRCLELLYALKEFASATQQWNNGFATPQQQLLQRYQQLVNNYYIEKRTVEEYAALMYITPNTFHNLLSRHRVKMR